MTQSKEYRDLVYVVDVLENGSRESFTELEKLVDGFPNGKDQCIGRYWIRHAIDCGALDSIEWMLSRGVDVTFCDDEGYTVVHSALDSASVERHKMLELLLKHGASVNAHGINGWTPAHMAGFREDIESLQLLIRYGADLAIRTSIDDFDTPLEEARRFGKNKTVEFLESLAKAD